MNAPPVYQAGGNASAIAAADLNGDRVPDIVTTSDLAGGDVRVMLSDGKGGFLAPATVPIQTSNAFPAASPSHRGREWRRKA